MNAARAIRWLVVGLAVLVLALWAAPARADFIDLPVKWSQTPHSTWDGYYSDHTGTTEQVMAEDFRCTDPDPIVAVRWWGFYSGESQIRDEEWVLFDISFHLSTGGHPYSVPAGPPVALYENVETQQAWTGECIDPPDGGEPVYRYDAYLPGGGFDQAARSPQSPNPGELFIDICQPGGQVWCWSILESLPEDDPILGWAAVSDTRFGSGGHDGPWLSTGDEAVDEPGQLAFELMTPEPATLALVGLGLVGGLLSRRRAR